MDKQPPHNYTQIMVTFPKIQDLKNYIADIWITITSDFGHFRLVTSARYEWMLSYMGRSLCYYAQSVTYGIV